MGREGHTEEKMLFVAMCGVYNPSRQLSCPGWTASLTFAYVTKVLVRCNQQVICSALSPTLVLRRAWTSPWSLGIMCSHVPSPHRTWILLEEFGKLAKQEMGEVTLCKSWMLFACLLEWACAGWCKGLDTSCCRVSPVNIDSAWWDTGVVVVQWRAQRNTPVVLVGC